MYAGDGAGYGLLALACLACGVGGGVGSFLGVAGNFSRGAAHFLYGSSGRAQLGALLAHASGRQIADLRQLGGRRGHLFGVAGDVADDAAQLSCI